MKGYYYLHTNGSLIYKPAIVVDSDPSYFDSTFVRKVWSSDSENRADAWTIMLESLAMGANVDRAKELSVKWGLTLEDFYEFMMRNTDPNELLKSGIIAFAEKILDMPEDEFFEKLGKHNESLRKTA